MQFTKTARCSSVTCTTKLIFPQTGLKIPGTKTSQFVTKFQLTSKKSYKQQIFTWMSFDLHQRSLKNGLDIKQRKDKVNSVPINIDGTWRQGFIGDSCHFLHCSVWRIQRQLNKKSLSLSTIIVSRNRKFSSSWNYISTISIIFLCRFLENSWRQWFVAQRTRGFPILFYDTRAKGKRWRTILSIWNIIR